MLAALATVLARLPELPGSGMRTDPKPYVAVFGIGFLVAVFGHIFKVKAMVAAGVVMIFMATVVLPLWAHFTSF